MGRGGTVTGDRSGRGERWCEVPGSEPGRTRDKAAGSGAEAAELIATEQIAAHRTAGRELGNASGRMRPRPGPAAAGQRNQQASRDHPIDSPSCAGQIWYRRGSDSDEGRRAGMRVPFRAEKRRSLPIR